VTVRGRVASLLEMGAGFHPDLTGRENVFLNGSILGMKRSDIRAAFDSIVDFAELHQFIDTPVKRYSSGMYTRLAFAVAVHVNPDILLVDEVLAVGDKAFQEKSLGRAHEMQSEDRTVVFVSHNLYAVQALCQRGVFLNQGRVEYVGPINQAMQRYEAHLLKSGQRTKTTTAPRSGREWHSSGVRIDEVRVCDAQGVRREEFALGQPFAVQVAYQAERRVERPIVGVGIKRADGVLVAAASTRFDGYDLPAIEDHGRLQVLFDPAMLGPGIYTINAQIYDSSHSYPYTSWEQAASFRIRSTENGLIDSEGIYHLPHRWSSLR
jgi:ABC-type multidrug transport system ATPase subunit